jgi:hypothetical protein
MRSKKRNIQGTRGWTDFVKVLVHIEEGSDFAGQAWSTSLFCYSVPTTHNSRIQSRQAVQDSFRNVQVHYGKRTSLLSREGPTLSIMLKVQISHAKVFHKKHITLPTQV